MAESVPGLLWLVVLLAGNAFFVAAEFAVISARRSQIEPRAEEGSRAARTTLWAMENATLMLATSQLGITVCSLLILNVSEPAIHHLLEAPLGLTSLPEAWINAGGFAVTLLLVTYLHVVFGEMVPKNLSFSVPDRAALLLAPPLVFVSRVVRPVIATLNWTANRILRTVRVQPKDEANSTYTLDQVAHIVGQAQREGTVRDEAGTLAGAFEFTSKTVRDVEVPLVEAVVLPVAATPADVQRAVVEHSHSRYLVADESGAPFGYLHLKDVMDILGDGFDLPVPAKRVRRLIAIPQDADLEDALARLRRHGVHVARTVDPQGATRGLLFLEDVLEILVGEVNDASAA